MTNSERLAAQSSEHEPGLEYNLAGGLILSSTEPGFKFLADTARRAEFDQFTILPFRGYNPENSRQEALPIVHIEEAWNPTSQENILLAMLSGTWGYIKRLSGEKDAPILQDAFFPSEQRCCSLFNSLLKTYSAKLISYTILPHRLIEVPSDRWLLEINPGVAMSPEELVDWSQKNGTRLVFDPSHLQHWQSGRSVSSPGQPTEPIDNTMTLFHQLAKTGIIEGVDLNSANARLDDHNYNCGLLKRGKLAELISASQHYDSIQFLRLELPLAVQDQIRALFNRSDPELLLNMTELVSTIRK